MESRRLPLHCSSSSCELESVIRFSEITSWVILTELRSGGLWIVSFRVVLQAAQRITAFGHP